MNDLSSDSLAGHRHTVGGLAYGCGAASVTPSIFWAPANCDEIETALDLARVEQADSVLDLGCGDGRVLSAVVQRGAKAVGIEIDQKLGDSLASISLHPRCDVVFADMFRVNFNALGSNVVYAFLTSAMLQRLIPQLQQMPAGTRIVTVRYIIPGWTPVASSGKCHLYVLPANSSMSEPLFEWGRGGLVIAVPVAKAAVVSLVLSHPVGQVDICAWSTRHGTIEVRAGVDELPSPGVLGLDVFLDGEPDFNVSFARLQSPSLGDWEMLCISTHEAIADVWQVTPGRFRALSSGIDEVRTEWRRFC